MDEKKEARIIGAYPLLYGDRSKSPQQTCMCFGFECGDGWEDLLWRVSGRLEPLIRKYIDENPDLRCRYCDRPRSKHDDTEKMLVPFQPIKPVYHYFKIHWKRVLKAIITKRMITPLIKDFKMWARWHAYRASTKFFGFLFTKFKIGKRVPICDQYEGRYPRASQVKEKFGGLRFYMTHATDEMYDITDAAEQESEEICEQCGAPGELRGNAWLTTLCQPCHNINERRKEEYRARHYAAMQVKK